MKHRLAAILTTAFLLTSPVHAEEYFGQFLDDLHGSFIDESDGRPKFRLDEEFVFEDPNQFAWPVPAGVEVDGASIPEWLWSFAAPFSGDYLWASVIHDYYCDTKIRTAHDTHRNFYYGMLAKGVERWKADFMYWAVATFGPQWELDRPVVVNAVALAAARGKAAAIARTLRWSGGEFLDVGLFGKPVPATIESIEESASFYRELISSEDYLRDPSKMGLMGFWTSNIADATWKTDPLDEQPVFWQILPLANIPADSSFLMGRDGAFDPSNRSVEAQYLLLDDLSAKLR